MQNAFPNAVRNHMNIGYDLLHRDIEDIYPCTWYH